MNIVGLLTGVDVTESNGVITIYGLDASRLSTDMSKRWGTGTLYTYIFNDGLAWKLRIDSFFAIELLYIVNDLLTKKQSFRVQTPRRHLAKVRELLLTKTWINSTTKESSPWLNKSKASLFVKTPLKHQLDFINVYEKIRQLYHLNGMILAAAAGSGKTYTNLLLAEMTECKTIILIVPLVSVYRVWKKALDEEFKFSPRYWISADGKAIDTDAKYYVFHYEDLGKAVDFVKNNNIRKPYIGLDESHNINEITSARTQKFIELCEVSESENVIWGSGTPIKAMGGELVPFLRTADPFFTDEAQRKFLKIFGKKTLRAGDIVAHRLGYSMYEITNEEYKRNTTGKYTVVQEEVNVAIPNGRDYTLDAIRTVMKEYINERTKYYKDHFAEYKETFYRCLALHEKTLTTKTEEIDYNTYVRYIQMIIAHYDPVEMKDIVVYCNLYEKKIASKLPTELKEPFKNAKSVVKYVTLKIQGEVLGRVLGKLREECCTDMVPYMGLDSYINDAVKKTVIFTSYTESANKANKYLIEKGYKPILIHSNAEDLLKGLKRFENDPDANPLITTFKSLSTAMPLTMASTGIMMNPPFREHERKQTVARLDRLGQDTDVTFFTFLLDTGNDKNISTRSKDIMEWSRDQVAEMMGTKIPDEMALSMVAPSINWSDLFGKVLNAVGYDMEHYDMESKPKDIFWHSNFGPAYTPMEMLDLGIFEGIYTHAIKDIPAKYKQHKNVVGENKPDISLNKFKVKSRTSLSTWIENNWTTKDSPLGWWEWYVKYYEGRRLAEDTWQIKRWNSFVARHQGAIVAAGQLHDMNARLKQRQALLQWAWDSEVPYSDAVVVANAKKLAKKCNLPLGSEKSTYLR